MNGPSRSKLAKSPAVFFLGLLLFSACSGRHNADPASLPMPTGPLFLKNQHQALLTQARSCLKDKDSLSENLLDLLEYHFHEEELYVFPVLGTLPQLAEGRIPEHGAEILELVAQFRSNSAKLNAEHQMIRTMMEECRGRYLKSNNGLSGLEKALGEHAETEEVIYFPAVLLAGEYLKGHFGDPGKKK